MAFRTLGDRVVIRRVSAKDVTRGGILIPDAVQEKPHEGMVVTVGPGTRDPKGVLHPLTVKKSERVLFGKFSGTEVKLDGETLVVIKEDDIIGIVD